MSKVNIVSEELEVMLHKLILAAQYGDEKAMNHLDIIKELLKNN